METWKNIDIYPNYQVSNFGRVRKFRNGNVKYLKLTKNGNGYLHLNIFLDSGGYKTIKAHQLVAMAFLGHKPNGFEFVINHIDFNRENNNVDNLEIIPFRENTNKKHLKSTSKYVGVYWSNNRKRWVAEININRNKKYLGSFKNEYDAHLAYENKLNELSKNY